MGKRKRLTHHEVRMMELDHMIEEKTQAARSAFGREFGYDMPMAVLARLALSIRLQCWGDLNAKYGAKK